MKQLSVDKLIALLRIIASRYMSIVLYNDDGWANNTDHELIAILQSIGTEPTICIDLSEFDKYL